MVRGVPLAARPPVHSETDARLCRRVVVRPIKHRTGYHGDSRFRPTGAVDQRACA